VQSLIYYTCKSVGSDYATGWKAQQSGFDSFKQPRFFSSPKLSDQLWDQPIPANCSLEIMRLGREFDCLPQSSIDVKNAWSDVSNPSCVFKMF
jgi:hypothetical protein